MSTWQFFDAETGLPTGRSFTGDAESVDAQTPPGCKAVEVDAADPAHRLDVATGELEAWRPPQPAADPMVTWAWSDAERRWIGTPTFAARQAERIAAVDQLLGAAETKQQRPLGDILAAMTSGGTPSADDVARLAEIRAYVAAGRAARAALAAATTDDALQAVRWP